MIAGRRVRKRPLIPAAMKAVITRNLSMVDNATWCHLDPRRTRQDGLTAILKESSQEPIHSWSISPSSDSSQQLATMKYLRQLSSLYTAGVLTSEEFLAARGRLLGS